MEIAGNIFSMVFIATMTWQDFKTRTIAAWLLPAIGICFLVGEASVLSQHDLLRNSIVNFTLLIVQFTTLWLWMSARKRKWINIIDTQIGLGDILLLVCLAPAFSPFNFFLFYTSGAILAIAVHLVMVMIRKNHPERIPLAGILGLPLVAMCMLRLYNPGLITISSDEQFINYITP